MAGGRATVQSPEVLRRALAENTGTAGIGHNTGEVLADLVPVNVANLSSANIDNVAEEVAAGAVTIRRATNRNTADVMSDYLLNGTAIKVVFEGDSITYAQDTVSGSTRPAINGAPHTRSLRSMPEAFKTVVDVMGGASISIYNNGYPGDTAEAGFNRWKVATANAGFQYERDLTVIMYGHNDAIGYGLGPVTPEDYARSLEKCAIRRLLQGSAVIICAPPIVEGYENDSKIRTFGQIAENVARRLGVQFFDASLSLRNFPADIWTDGVHLSEEAYQKLGWDLAIMAAGVAVKREPRQYWGFKDFVLYPFGSTSSGQQTVNAALNLTFEKETFIQPGQTVIALIDCQRGGMLRVRVRGATGGGVSFLQLGGLLPGKISRSGVVLDNLQLWRVNPGPQVLTMTNNGSSTAGVMEFEVVDEAKEYNGFDLYHRDIEGLKIAPVSPMQWVGRVARETVGAPCTTSFNVKMGSVGQLGVGLFKSKDRTAEYNGDGLLILRANADLVFKLFESGVQTDTATVAFAFTAATDYEGELSVSHTGSQIDVYAGGSLIGSYVTTKLKNYYPGVVCAQAAGALRCDSAYSQQR
ncbi:SGNH/GDSL hydrolase family protein [Spongiibacter marinus]|uniref:SGNH/GDSL hydrolase family protein n=1 Tax=Spongiibacter marinus TaxID=354246 RepID=UPI00195F9ED7|nr:SGNH/GDSL hydrolase family protein [Spongiibacter marinus]MBM7424987.1 lysophospholipase L1-like esterase [Spongiibacter marinus]